MPALTMTKKASGGGRSRRFSLSNSISSSSLDTVIGRGESPNQPRESRPLSGLFKARSSQTLQKDATVTTAGPSAPSRRKRRLSISDGVSSTLLEVKEGVGNLHRWSQSTVSSGASTSHNRRASTSARLSFGAASPRRADALLAPSTSPSRHPSDMPDQDLEGNKHPQFRPARESPKPSLSPSLSSPGASGDRARRVEQSTQAPVAGSGCLPPPLTVSPPSLSAHASAQSSATVTPINPSPSCLTPSSFPQGADYFGANWKIRSPQRNAGSSRPSGPDWTIDPDSSPLRTAGSTFQSQDWSGEGAANRSSRNFSRSNGLEDGRGRGPAHPRTPEARPNAAARGRSNSSSSPKRRRTRDHDRRARQSSQKAMLAKALQQANTAVLLDNAHNFEGAMDSYGDACALLQQVMNRSYGEEDRRKLDAIRSTYTNRIRELRTISLHDKVAGKALPARPESDGPGSRDSAQSALSASDGSLVIETATVTRLTIAERPQAPNGIAASQVQIPKRHESLMPSPLEEVKQLMSSTPSELECIPQPLSTRRPNSPTSARQQPIPQSTHVETESNVETLEAPFRSEHSRPNSTESISWLDTIEESGDSSASSVRSRLSSSKLPRSHTRAGSGNTEAEFEAALDAAVEAAYDDGLESPGVGERFEVLDTHINPHIDEEEAREAEREVAIDQVKEKGEGRPLGRPIDDRAERPDVGYSDAEIEEEERMLEEVTRGFSMDDFEFDLQTKSALPPRQSDSSGFSGRTGSSVGSNPTTAGTSLQTLAEAPTLPSLPKELQSRSPPPPANSPPGTALPNLPTAPLATAPPLPSSGPPPRPPSLVDPLVQSVRIRRLSSQAHKPLKIDIVDRPPRALAPSTESTLLPPLDFSSGSQEQRQQSDSYLHPVSTPLLQGSSQRSPSPYVGPSPSRITPDTPGLFPGLSRVLTQESEGNGAPNSRAGSPVQPSGKFSAEAGLVRKNHSSSSLRNRNLSVSSPDESDVSPNTPTILAFSAGPSGLRQGSAPSVPALPLSGIGAGSVGTVPAGGLHLFDSDIHLSDYLGLEGRPLRDPPAPLEPCPTENLLRPFWLMRCLYQTIAHPRGGYVSTKLFIPRDVWHVKGVKIRGLEEKISNCDLLTAALLKLRKVDTCDADAVLEEMQSFETVLEQVQVTLTKKLGNEVGLQGSATLFRDYPTGNEQSSVADSTTSKHFTSSNKSYLSWKRLRSKNSGAGLLNSLAASKDVPKEALNLSTVPMASSLSTRAPKRDLSLAQFTGPNAVYMSALARLFDAVQVLDQIGRQVEDPGLKYSSPTYVGMELSTRHAAEFFAFYVCRFALTDVSALLDKFIKRSSEWVLV